MEKCILCGQSVIARRNNDNQCYLVFYECPTCGDYSIYENKIHLIQGKEHLIAGYLFETEEAKRKGNSGGSYFRLDADHVKQILSSPLIPSTMSDRILKVLTYIDAQTKTYGDEIKVLFQAGYFHGNTERDNLFQDLFEKGLIRNFHSYMNKTCEKVGLTLEGYKYIEEHKREMRSDQCFVAMWFNKETGNLWEKAIEPGCKAAGYNPVKIDRLPHNDNIADKILAEIRKSFFLIADFTGQNRGVYYEAGFAKGLGKQVVQLCRSDYFDGTDKDHKMHFDNTQINTLIWEKGKEENLKDQITFRIEANFGKGTYAEKEKGQ